MSESKIYLAVIGFGGVGKEFLAQLTLLPASICPALIFLSRTKKNIFSEDYRSIDIASCERLLSSSKSPLLDMVELRDYLAQAPGPAVLVDNTSSPDIAKEYPAFLGRGISIVTPNKKAFSGSLALWEDIMTVTNSGRAMVYHESSVGAGLPVISTLKDLVATGDKVVKVEGVFSGTMSFLFNTFAPTTGPSNGKWSKIVADAKNAGYTEPDPRDDLNGMDVARKLTILARIAGLKIKDPNSFPVQSLIPKELESVQSAEEFMRELPKYDDQMEAYKEHAKRANKVVRYIGSIDMSSKAVKVGLEMVDPGSPIAGLKGSDNLMCFYTERYGANPLVIQGAGAGGAVTAMGVTADLIKVMERLR
ncbi:MAG: hypothetical protein Q9227_003566 [Pyrenula ochraceoflavens]